jgi:hypothetical protein
LLTLSVMAISLLASLGSQVKRCVTLKLARVCTRGLLVHARGLPKPARLRRLTVAIWAVWYGLLRRLL